MGKCAENESQEHTAHWYTDAVPTAAKRYSRSAFFLNLQKKTYALFSISWHTYHVPFNCVFSGLKSTSARIKLLTQEIYV